MKVLELMACGELPLLVTFYGVHVPAGFPSPAEDYLESQLDLNDYLVRNKTATFLMRVEGDSMIGAGIFHGDLLIVDRSAKPVSGSIVVVALNGEHTVKRLRRAAECVWLEPENPRYEAIRVDEGADLHVFGVVQHTIRTHR